MSVCSVSEPVIAVILARQNSKGIPLKNLQKVAGVSLVGRAIKAAQDSGVFDEIYVSTDGDQIAEEAKLHGAKIIVRPDNLAGDHATSMSGMLHVFEVLDLKQGISCLLQPTSPLRTGEHIRLAYKTFVDEKARSVVAACPAEHHPLKTLLQEDDGAFRPVREIGDLESPRQRLPKAFRPNGAIYFNHIEDLIKEKRFFVNPLSLFIMDDISSIDIDHISDLERANALIAKG